MNQYTTVVIVISTTGQGDVPANARRFWKSLLRKRLPADYLHGVQTTIFGLGDTSYPKFNWAARKLRKRVLQLGALEYYSSGEGDEQHEGGLDAAFIPWSSGLRNQLLSKFPLEEGLVPIPENGLVEPNWLLRKTSRLSIRPSYNASNGDPTSYQVDEHREDAGQRMTAGRYASEALSDSTKRHDERFVVKVQENRRVTPAEHWQDVRHLTFTSDTPVPYGPGDVLSVYPLNHCETVNELIALMEWSNVADEAIEFVPTSSKHSEILRSSPPLDVSNDQTLSLRYLLTNHLDITAVPRRSFFSMIAHFTSDQFHKDRLLEFTDPDLVDELYDYTTRPRRSILEVLQEFETIKIPWQRAASIFPELRRRQFSIASGGHLKTYANNCGRFELLVAIVRYRTVIKKLREGVCTKYLAGLKHDDRISVSLQRGGLGIEKADFRTPTIMIGPGTGIAPLRSLIWERMLWRRETSTRLRKDHNEMTTEEASMENDLLFFGCRNERADYFYNDEWEKLYDEGALLVHTAFSRDQARKRYIQDAIKEHAGAVYDMLHLKGANVYVCGSSGKMPVAVRAALVDVIETCGNVPGSTPMNKAAALRYIEAMEKEGRYKQETW